MNRSHLDKLSESYAQIAEGKKSEEEVKDWNRKDDNPQGKKVDKKKVDKCTCESFYLKRLHAMNPVYAEQYRAIAEILIGEGYESARLLDNIIEALPMDVVGPEFVSAMKAVNPRIHENLDTAEKRQARAIVSEQIRFKSWDEWKRGIKSIPGNLQRAGQAVSDFINPPASKSADPVVRQGGSYTGPSGTATTSSSSGPTPEQRAEKLRQQRQETQDALRGTTGTAQTGERSAAANDAKQQAAKAQAQAARTGGTSGSTGGTGSTGSAYTSPRSTGPITTAQAGDNRGSYKSPTSTWVDPKANATQQKTHIGRHLTLKQHRAAVAKQNQTVTSSYQPEGELVDEGIGLALGAGAIAGGLALWKAHQGAKTVDRIKKDADSGTGKFGAIKKATDAKNRAMQQLQNNSFAPEGEMVSEMNESTKSVFESLKQARKNVGASTCWDGYKAKGTKTKNGKEVPNCVKEGIRDEDAEKGTKERKERLEKKRGHKVDDHPQFKKDKKDDSYLETNMKKRHENNEKARKEMADKKDDTVPRWMKDDFNLYDVVLTYLDENEIMESVEHAEAIMEQLTAEQIESIVEEVLGEQSSTRSMVDQVTDALPWNRNTEYTTQGVRRKPGENVHGQQTGRRPPGTASMSAGGTAPTNRPPGTGGKLVQRNR